jgi:hypothetical protein
MMVIALSAAVGSVRGLSGFDLHSTCGSKEQPVSNAEGPGGCGNDRWNNADEKRTFGGTRNFVGRSGVGIFSGDWG